MDCYKLGRRRHFQGCQLPTSSGLIFLAAKAFRVTWSMRICEAFPARSPRMRHRNELTESDWENAVQGLGKAETRDSLSE